MKSISRNDLLWLRRLVIRDMEECNKGLQKANDGGAARLIGMCKERDDNIVSVLDQIIQDEEIKRIEIK